jgi:cytochrome c553
MKPIALTVAVMVAAGGTLAVAQTQNRSTANPPAKSPAPAPASTQAQGAAQGAGGVQQCIACHGEHGEGNAQGGFPRLAGQSQDYLLHQLESYANGSRRNPVMEPIAKGLSREARTAAAAYYARVQIPVPSGATTGSASSAPVNARGEVLATRGDDSKQVQGCGNCHGPGGIGEPPEIPYLAGLDAAYLTAALNAFKSGTRRNDAGAQMRTVARGLSPEDIGAVSQYFASLSPPARPAPENIVRAPSSARPATGAAAASTPSSRQPAGATGQVGSEQGAGTSGGTQGAGGVDQASTAKKGGSTSGR